MVIAVVVLGGVLLVVSARRLRNPRPGQRWPLVAAAALAGLVVALSVGGALAASTVGRTTWNAWVAGSPHRESLTLGLVIVGVPLLLALAVLFLVIDSLADGRRRRRGPRKAHPPR